MKTAHTGNSNRKSKRTKRQAEWKRIVDKFGDDSAQVRHLLSSLSYRYFVAPARHKKT